MTGQRIVIDGLSAVQTDVLLLVQLRDGTQHSAILRPASPGFTIPTQASKLKVAGDYWLMGTIHILEGIDHLLFVFALLLLVSGIGTLLKAVTAFTIAHSITLAPPRSVWRLLLYCIGGVAAYWTIGRVMAFLPVAV